MGIHDDTVVQLIVEGITRSDDVEEFDNETLKQVAKNLHHPAGQTPEPDATAGPGATIPTPPFIFGAKSQKCLHIAAKIV